MKLQKIHSFTIDHSVHGPDFYLSGEKNGIFTYDLRFKWPNKGDYLDVAAMHPSNTCLRRLSGTAL